MPTVTDDFTPRRPRRRPAPTQRDQQIYVDYQIGSTRQTALAEKYRLTQCRISQIVRRVKHWIQCSDSAGVALSGSAGVAVGGAADHGRKASSSRGSLRDQPPPACSNANAKLRLQRRLEHERLNFVCREAMRHFQEEQKTVTHKKGDRGNTSIDETTERRLPPNVQCLKVVLQANAQLSRLESRPPLDDDRAESDHDFRQKLEAWLVHKRHQAAQDGKVPNNSNEEFVIHELVGIVLGEPNRGVALDLLALYAGKKLVDRKPYDDSPPQVPPRNGWYYPMYDAHGSLVAWLTADQVATATAACGVDLATLEPAIAATGFPPPERADADVASPSAPKCSIDHHRVAVGDEVNHGELRANALSEDQAVVRSATHGHASAPSTTSASPVDSPQPLAANNVPAKPAAQKISDEQWNNPPPPRQLPPAEPPTGFDDPEERRWRHHVRLQQLRDAQAAGRFHNFTFYAADGPVP